MDKDPCQTVKRSIRAMLDRTAWHTNLQEIAINFLEQAIIAEIMTSENMEALGRMIEKKKAATQLVQQLEQQAQRPINRTDTTSLYRVLEARGYLYDESTGEWVIWADRGKEWKPSSH